MLTVSGYTGYRYFTVTLVLGLVWLSIAWLPNKNTNDRPWARKMFAFSVLTIFIMNIMMAVDFSGPSVSSTRAEYVSQAGVLDELGFEQSRLDTTSFVTEGSEPLVSSESD
jgi:hypothetical protein